VKDVLRDGLSVYSVDAELLKRLQPEVIVTQSHCEVCAVSERDVEKALGRWLYGRPTVVSLAPQGLNDVWDDVRRVGVALGADDLTIYRVVEDLPGLRGRVENAAARALKHTRWPTVACIEWIDPLMAAGNWVPELVALAGGVNLFGEAGKH